MPDGSKETIYLFTWYHQHMTKGSISTTNNHTMCMLPKPKQETRALVQLFCLPWRSVKADAV